MSNVSSPVTGRQFVDRQQELRDLEGITATLLAGGRDDVAILGHRKIGKTSLLRELIRRTTAPGLGICYLDLWESIPDLADFVARYLAAILDALMIARVRSGHDAPALLVSSSLHSPSQRQAAFMDVGRVGSASARQAASLIEDALARRADVHLLREALDLPEKLAGEQDLRLLVVLDEFQELAGINRATPFRGTRGDVFAVMRGRWQTHRHVGYAVAGSRVSMMRELLIDRRAPFFQHFRILELGPLPAADAAELFRSGLVQAGLEPTDDVVRRAVAVTGGHPFYLQVLCNETCRCGGTDAPAAFKSAIQGTLLGPAGRLALYFEDLVGKVAGRSVMLEQVLLQVARGNDTVGGLSKELHCNSGAVVTALRRLSDLVVKSGDRYVVTDPCLVLWLQSKTEIGRYLPALVVGTEAELAVARHLALLGFRSVYQARASRGPFDLVAHHGAGVLALQVQQAELPVHVPRPKVERLLQGAAELGWIPLLAIVSGGRPRFYAPQELRTTARSAVVEPGSPEIDSLLQLVLLAQPGR